jgi:aryl-alcohol dehydrogenase-like predicted oxidoreductase
MAKISSTDLDVFPVAPGGNVFGWTANESESFAVLDAYVSGGGNFIDTADAYSAWAPGNSGGESESIIGRWLMSRKRRSNTIVATKVGKHPKFAPVASIALAWLAAQPTVAAPIASARTVGQLSEILRSAELHLSDAQLRKLSDASA